MQTKKYTLSLEGVTDYTMMSIMAGELYLIDEQGRKTHLHTRVLDNFQFIDNDQRVLFPILENIPKDGVNDWCVQMAVADLETETIHFFDHFFRNNGEYISYENGVVTVWNENNEFAKTEIIDLVLTPVQKFKKFEIFGNHNHYYKRFWNESRGDEFDNWGKSWWYFETDLDGNILRQIEEYETGMVQYYALECAENRFGGLGKMPLPFEEFKEYGIYKEDFEAVWAVYTVSKEQNLHTLLELIHPRPAMYLGEFSITAMRNFIHTYEFTCRYKGVEEKLNPGWQFFNEYVKQKTGLSGNSKSWHGLILEYCNGDEEKALDLFYLYFYEFRHGDKLNSFLKNLVPKHKHDMDFNNDLNFFWYNYNELKPIIPELLTWLQDPNWPVAEPISSHLSTMLPDILPELIPILEGEDGVWKYNILNYFFIKTKSPHYADILDLIKKLVHNPSENDKKEEVDILAKEILDSTWKGHQH